MIVHGHLRDVLGLEENRVLPVLGFPFWSWKDGNRFGVGRTRFARLVDDLPDACPSIKCLGFYFRYLEYGGSRFARLVDDFLDCCTYNGSRFAHLLDDFLDCCTTSNATRGWGERARAGRGIRYVQPPPRVRLLKHVVVLVRAHELGWYRCALRSWAGFWVSATLIWDTRPCFTPSYG